MSRNTRQIPQSEHNEHRIRRAFSWLERSEKARSNEGKFIFLWIAFNAAYGGEPTIMDDPPLPENRLIRNFLREIQKRDEHDKIGAILLEKHSATDPDSSGQSHPVQTLLAMGLAFVERL